MATINPYLNFNGNTEEVFNFYKAAFGTEFNNLTRFGDMPSSEEHLGGPELANQIMHISLPIGGDSYLMGSDVPASMPAAVNGTNFSIAVHGKSREEADKLYKALSAGGIEIMPMSEAPWGAYFGMLTDKFGINWMVEHTAAQ